MLGVESTFAEVFADLPAAATELADTAFRLQGFPASNTEKLPLVSISRFVERRALAAGVGRLDAAVQRLSRLDDEYATRRVYERLGATDLDVHLYGAPDAPLPSGIDATVPARTSDPYRNSWFVVYTPRDGRGDEAALVAIQTERNVWGGPWTYDAERVARARSAIEDAF